MEPITVEQTGESENGIEPNCGTITYGAAVTGRIIIRIDGHTAMIRTDHDPVDVAQRFADLLTDVTE